MKPSPHDAAFRRYIEKGLFELQKSDTPEARRTLRALTSGQVKVDGFSDLTAADFRHVRRDLPAERLTKLDARAVKRISKAINGYQWDDRIYVHRDLSPRRLASLLVHEVTHVLTRAEENYRGPKAALLQEYAAFYAEKRFLGVEMTPARCLALKKYVIELYELKGVTPADVPDRPTPPVAAPAAAAVSRSRASRASR